MRHISPPPVESTPLISTIADYVTVLGGLIAILVTIWQLILYRQLSANQRAIELKQGEIDAVPEQQLGKANNSPTPIAQPKLDKMIEAAQKPLRHELKILKRDRSFILDKLLFAKK